jgi:hypothetical protein
MLGRLRMSVIDVIKHYGTLSQRVFSDAKLIGRDGKFRASKLEEVIKEIVEEKTGRADEPMMDPRPEGEACRTYVANDLSSCHKADRSQFRVCYACAEHDGRHPPSISLLYCTQTPNI